MVLGQARKRITDYYRATKKRRPSMPTADEIALLAGLATRVQNQQPNSMTRTQTKTKEKWARVKGGLTHAPYKKMRKPTKRRAINSKPKSKRERKFNAKVLKAIKATKCYGEYIYHGHVQLRQDTTDRYGVNMFDFNGRKICIGDLRASIDAYSICFNGKSMGNDFQAITGNIDKRTTFSTAFEHLSMYFKSTSTHVVNIEVFELIPKMNLLENQRYDTIIYDSFNDYVNRWAPFNTAPEQTFGIDALGTASRHLTSLFQYYSVKVHNVKLLPGATSALSFKRKGRTLDQSKNLDTQDNTYPNTKGASYFFFRTLNDATVSGNPVNPGAQLPCHHWPSNYQGGVSMRYVRTIRCIPDNNLADNTAAQKPVVAIANWTNFNESNTDQQVVYNAPFKLAESAQ